MMITRTNPIAVVVAAVVYFVWGAIWYTAFGSLWQKLTGVHVQQPTTYIVSFIIGFPLAYAIAYLLRAARDPSAGRGAALGIVVGVGVWGTNLLEIDLYEKHPLALWAIDAGYAIIGMAIVGAIVGGWRLRRR